LLPGRNQARFGFDFNPEPYVAEDQGNRLLHPDRPLYSDKPSARGW
jgi:hypothetical protein